MSCLKINELYNGFDNFNTNTQMISDYDTYRYNFQNAICRMFHVNSVEGIEYPKDLEKFDEYNDQDTDLHKTYYQYMDMEFLHLYHQFIENCIHPFMGSDKSIVYQKIPTVRFHIPNNVGVGSYHKDSDFGHSRKELNFLLPLSQCAKTATIQIESEEDKEDYRPVNMSYGDLFIFYGSRLNHGNEINKENYMRISVDFRVMLHSDYEETETESITNKVKFKIGEYWNLIEAPHRVSSVEKC